MNFISASLVLSERLLHRRPLTVSYSRNQGDESGQHPGLPQGTQGAGRPRDLPTATGIISVGLGLQASSLGPGPPPFCQGEPRRSILATGKGSWARPGQAGSHKLSLPFGVPLSVLAALGPPLHILPALRAGVGTPRNRKKDPRIKDQP